MRNYKKLLLKDLREIKKYADEELGRFLYEVGRPKGKYSVYKNKLIAICLCQGAAQHFVDEKTGVKDFDVWFFFEQDDRVRIPARRNMRKWECKEFKRFGKKRVDFMKKGIKGDIIIMLQRGKNFECKALKSYLQNAHTCTSKFLAEKAVVGLHPDDIFGKVIWRGKSRDTNL